VKNKPNKEDANFRFYYDAAQYRTDKWSELRLLTARRERAETAGRESSELQEEIAGALDELEVIEQYWAFPGLRACRHLRSLLRRGLYIAQARQTERIVRLLVGDAYRRRDVTEIFHEDYDATDIDDAEGAEPNVNGRARPYFEVLVVDELGMKDASLRRHMLEMRRPDDDYIYDVVVVGSVEDALIAVLFNSNIQSVVLCYSFPYESTTRQRLLRRYLELVDVPNVRQIAENAPARALGEALKSVRPELDLFMVTDAPVRNVVAYTGQSFRRVFYQLEDYLELHLSLLVGIHDRHETPFFHALRDYSHRPTGVFHAMPISRGKSISKSHWIGDMGEFYGPNLFLAETSSTTGGLDSLLAPHGTIKKAQEKAARAFGAKRSYFSTNGTSTSNKIVMQAVLRPGDIALVSRDCHKSHHYSLVLAGAYPLYLDSYPLKHYSIYGAVPLVEIKRQLLALKRDGKLDRVRMLLLTNCTFDGIVYHPERIMREVLAIKPDMLFVWDEAWFAFARFSPTYRRRTAMEAASRLRAMLRDPAYRERYVQWKRDFDENSEDAWLTQEILPDPDLARVRVYATQSTHKTLTSLRQGSMIHVHDQDFDQHVSEAFNEAYMTHTSTSPNYQILASLDVGRRQVELEGYELVQESVGLAMALRERVEESDLLRPYFEVLTVKDLIPKNFRPSGLQAFYSMKTGYEQLDQAFRHDEFALDPIRVTLHVGGTGMDGDTFRTLLMDRFDIQINKTSRNSVLFMLNIGTTRGAIAYLLEVLTNIAQELNDKRESESTMMRARRAENVKALTEDLPPLPNFSRFHARFRPEPDTATAEGDLRAAFFLAYDGANCEFMRMDGSLKKAMDAGREVVSATFVTPYPPGFPVLVPGQVISEDILAYLKALDVKEVHGYNQELGFRVFIDSMLNDDATATAPALPTTKEENSI